MKRLLLSKIVQAPIEGNQDYFARKAVDADFKGLMDPVLGINHFEARKNVLGKHSHYGLSELFYIFEDSEPYQITGPNNEKATIEPGSLLWVWAARGIEHSEEPVNTGERVEGIQIFLNMPNDKKWYEPMSLSVSTAEIPVITNNGTRMRILCGGTAGIASGVKTPQDLTLLHISLEQGKELQHILPAQWSGTVFALEGRFDVMTAEETFEMEEGMVIAMSFSEYNEPIVFKGMAAAQLLFVSGEPLQQTQPLHGVLGKKPHLVSAGSGTRWRAAQGQQYSKSM